MSPPLFGVETEYALGATDSHGARLPKGPLLDRLMLRARRDLAHLPDGATSGMFLANASRFYVDCGSHPELATAECGDPWELVRHVRAGEAILLRLADADGGRRRSGRLRFFRCNVDYSGRSGGAVWGLHESYLHHLEPEQLPADLIPHLVSRLVYTGAGGFVNTTPGIEFVLSPRTPHLVRDVSRDSTTNRGIFHDKREHLAGGGHRRLHVLCGESLCSDLATWLRAGTTALVVALAEAGLRPGAGVALRDPVAAMQAFARDPACRTRVPTIGGDGLTALDVQRHYLALAEAHVGSAFMPPWAGDVCREWRTLLGRLAQGWEAVATTLDWAIKLALYRRHAESRGVAWETLTDWTPAIAQVSAALARAGCEDRALTAAALGPTSPIATALPRLRAAVGRMRLDWDRLGPVLDLRHELFEIDVRFGQLGASGIFTILDADGVLEHAVAGTGDVASAIDRPPDVPRARVRGELVRALSGNGQRYQCGWQGVWDCVGGAWVDLDDPFVADATWRPWTEAFPTPPLRFRAALEERGRRRRGLDDEACDDGDPIDLNNRALTLRKRDRLDVAERLLRRAITIEDAHVAADSPKRPHRRNNLTLVLLRADKLDEAAALNGEAWALKAGGHDVTSGRILFARVALELLRARSVTTALGQLKTLLGGPLTCQGNVTRTWDIPDVVTTLSQRLEAADADLMADLAEVLNDRRRLAVLEAHERWVAATPVALDHPWPARPI